MKKIYEKMEKSSIKIKEIFRRLQEDNIRIEEKSFKNLKKLI